MEKIWDAYVYGDVNIDLVIPDVDSLPAPGQEVETEVMETFVGGGAALFTLGLGKLGLRPVFQGSVGNDCYGAFILEEVRKNNVDDSLITISETEKTGISISFTNKNDRSFLTYRGTNAGLDIMQADVEKIARAGHIHITGYEGKKNHDRYLAFLKKIKEKTDTTVSLDVGWDPTGAWSQDIYQLFPYIDVLFMNETESVHYSRMSAPREAAEEFAKKGPIAVMKLGSKGSIAVQEGRFYEAASYKVEAVDTTGAGDSFNAGFIYGFIKKKSISECLCYGNGCGALSVTALGGNSGFPSRERLEEFIESRRQENG